LAVSCAVVPLARNRLGSLEKRFAAAAAAEIIGLPFGFEVVDAQLSSIAVPQTGSVFTVISRPARSS